MLVRSRFEGGRYKFVLLKRIEWCRLLRTFHKAVARESRSMFLRVLVMLRTCASLRLTDDSVCMFSLEAGRVWLRFCTTVSVRSSSGAKLGGFSMERMFVHHCNSDGRIDDQIPV